MKISLYLLHYSDSQAGMAVTVGEWTSFPAGNPYLPTLKRIVILYTAIIDIELVVNLIPGRCDQDKEEGGSGDCKEAHKWNATVVAWPLLAF